MTADRSNNITENTNGHVKIEQQIAETRAVLREKPSRLRSGLIVPALLAVGVLFVWRRFEQGTSN